MYVYIKKLETDVPEINKRWKEKELLIKIKIQVDPALQMRMGPQDSIIYIYETHRFHLDLTGQRRQTSLLT